MATFHPFPRLPPELRLMIWEFAVEPRVFQVLPGKYDGETESWERRHHEQAGLVLTKPSDLFVVMAVCHEARDHLEKVYIKVNFDQFANDGAYVRFNPRVDTIHVHGNQLEHLVQEPEAKFIQILMVEYPYPRPSDFLQDHLRDLDDTLKTVIVSCRAWGRSDEYDVTFEVYEDDWENWGGEDKWEYWGDDDDDAREIMQARFDDGSSKPTRDIMDHDWTSFMCNIIAPLYWRCDPAPFHTKSYSPNTLYTEEVTENNYVEKERIFHVRWAHGEGFGGNDPERTINNADEYWEWQHDSCECEDKEENIGQHLLDECIEKYPVDTFHLSPDGRDEGHCNCFQSTKQNVVTPGL